MSENKEETIKKLTPIEVVERYYEKYLEYEKAFAQDKDSKDTERKVKELATSGIDLESEEFNDRMMELVIATPQKIADVNNAAMKFMLFADFYLLTETEPLPEKMEEDYKNLPLRENIKNFFSVDNGKFVRNTEVSIMSDDMKKYFKAIIQQIENN